jgi:hypothetical protein
MIEQIRQKRELDTDEIDRRLGFYSRSQEVITNQTKGEFEGKQQREFVALKAIAEQNQDEFARVSENAVKCGLDLHPRDDGRKIRVQIETEEGIPMEQVIEVKDAIKLLESEKWDGVFQTDTNVRLPIGEDEKGKLLQGIELGLKELVQSQATELEQIKPIINSLWHKVQMAELEGRIPYSDILESAKSVIKRNTGELLSELQNEQMANVPTQTSPQMV